MAPLGPGPAVAMAGLTIDGSCCFWALARTTMRTARVGCAGLAVLAPAKHLVRESIEQAIVISCNQRLANDSTHCNKGDQLCANASN